VTVNRRGLMIGGAVALGLGGAGWAGSRRMGSADDMAAHAAAERRQLSATPAGSDLIRFATLAANGHNTQPWRFRETQKGIDILPDFRRRTPVVDPDDHHIFISLGCAAENLALAVAARGRGGEVAFDPAGDGTVRVTRSTTSGPNTALFDAIPARQSTRSDYDGAPVSLADLGLLGAAAAMPGVDLVLITQAAQIARIRDLVVAANTARSPTRLSWPN